VVAFILTALACALFVLIGMPQIVDLFRGPVMGKLVKGIAHLSMLRHFAAISRGVLDVRDLLYFVLTTFGWLLAGVLLLDLKRTR
jgi:ABC-2 type transport system permease protein